MAALSNLVNIIHDVSLASKRPWPDSHQDSFFLLLCKGSLRLHSLPLLDGIHLCASTAASFLQAQPIRLGT